MSSTIQANCAGVIVFNNNLTKTILVKTPEGHYSFPKGSRLKQETSIDNALREMNEETGLTADQLLCLKDTRLDEINDNGKLSIQYYIAKLKMDTNNFQFDKNELSEVSWYLIKDADKLTDLLDRRKLLLSQAHQLIADKTDDDFLDGCDLKKPLVKTPKTSAINIKRMEKISRSLSKILRHTAIEMGLNVHSDGSVIVADLLKVSPMRGVSFDDLQYVVDHNDKQRFKLFSNNGTWFIRASQGHSHEVGQYIKDADCLDPITTPLETCIHGTTLTAWKTIKTEGLKPMQRKHIHFAIDESEDIAISGFRKNSSVLIYLDMKKAMDDGIKFFLSDNKVILSLGLDGVIDPKYFKNVVIKN